MTNSTWYADKHPSCMLTNNPMSHVLTHRSRQYGCCSVCRAVVPCSLLTRGRNPISSPPRLMTGGASSGRACPRPSAPTTSGAHMRLTAACSHIKFSATPHPFHCKHVLALLNIYRVLLVRLTNKHALAAQQGLADCALSLLSQRGAMRRKGFPEVQAVTNHIISAMRKARGAQLPLEKAALCVTLDVIGRVGFQKDFGSTASFEAAIEGRGPAPSGEYPLGQLALFEWVPTCFRGAFTCQARPPAHPLADSQSGKCMCVLCCTASGWAGCHIVFAIYRQEQGAAPG